MSHFESLERRTLLAGNVNVALVGGHLVINGDAADNDLSLQPNPEVVGGILILAVGDTSINGEFAPVALPAVTGDIRISLRGGADRLTIESVDAAKALSVDAGAGNDVIQIEGVEVTGRTTIWTADGADKVFMTDVRLKGGAGLATGAGFDVIATEAVASDGDCFIRGGRGSDTVSLSNTTFNGDAVIQNRPGEDVVSTDATRLSYDFTNGAQGWIAQYADWQEDNPDDYQFDNGIRALPANLGAGTGFYIGGRNGSDDLLMYLTRQLGEADGVVEGQSYLVRFRIKVASNAPSNVGGVGGAPGESVYLKAGATRKTPAFATDVDGIVRSTLDHGQQSQGGADASVVGTIANGIDASELPDLDDVPYATLDRTHIHTTVATAGKDGKLHLIVGTDSGYEGFTGVYYQRVDVALVPVKVA